MSDPVTMFAISTAMAAASGGASLAAAKGNADAQTEANEIAAENALIARDSNYDQLNLLAAQEKAAAEQQINQNQEELLKATATAETAAGESGVSGLSVDALLADMYGKSAQFEDNVTQNLENKEQQIGFELENAGRGYQSTINNLPTVQQPDYLGTALSTGSSIFGAYKDHLKV